MVANDETRDERRAALAVTANPRPDVDYLVGMTHSLSAVTVAHAAGSVQFNLRYVPDREIVTSAAWPAYVDELGSRSWPELENLATTAFDDLINELVPRRLCLKVSADAHVVVLQDQQPNWQNPALLAS